MADYTNSRFGPRSLPEGAIDSSRQAVEPLLTPDLLKTRHLFGVSLQTSTKDPVTGKVHTMTDDILQDVIDGAISVAEEEAHINIFPTKVREKLPFDAGLYRSFGYMQLGNRPVYSLDSLTITPSSGVAIFTVPSSWVETAQLVRGQLNIVPLTLAFQGVSYVPQAESGSGIFWLSMMTSTPWVASWWQVDYTTGFPDGMLPRVVNDYVGTIAAMEVLSQLALSFARTNSHSLGIDGLSQSSSGPGQNIYTTRIAELEKKRDLLRKKIKVRFGGSIFSGTL
jgi:hypothetical protein